MALPFSKPKFPPLSRGFPQDLMNSQDNDGMQTDVRVFYTLKSAIHIWDCHYMPEKFVKRPMWGFNRNLY